MEILLLGDGHAYGYGLGVRQLSYVGHFVRQLTRTGRAVTVEAYAHLTLRESTATLGRLPLGQYDLIVLQPGFDLIRRGAATGGPVPLVVGPVLPALNRAAQPGNRISLSKGMQRVGDTGKTLFDVVASVVPTVGCPDGLAQLLTLLRPYRHMTLLMTPFPRRTLLGQLAGAQSRSVLLEEGMDQAFSVFDTGAVVQPREEYFLTGDGEHLNAVSHELIGRALFDFYQSAPTIVTVQTINRNEDA